MGTVHYSLSANNSVPTFCEILIRVRNLFLRVNVKTLDRCEKSANVISYFAKIMVQ